MSSLNPYDYCNDAQDQTHSLLIRYWCHEQYNGDESLSDEPDDGDSSGQPCEPADEALDEPLDGIVDDTGEADGSDEGASDGLLDPPENTGELGGEEDTPQW